LMYQPIEDRKLADHFEAYVQEQSYSGTILVAEQGEVRFLQAYGKANYEHGVPNRTNMKFHIASITKPITAMAVLMLAERSRIDLHGAVGKYLPLVSPAVNGHITIHQLLTHTSGIPDFEKLPDYPYRHERMPYKDEDILQLIQDVEPTFGPGEGWSYCNTGYNLLGLLIERVAGMSYERFVRTNILDPLEMRDTTFGSSEAVIADLASGYSRDDEGRTVKARYFEAANFKASGHMISTAGDLLKWDRALYPGRLVSGELLKLMFAPHAFVDPTRHYGYGWSIYGDGSRGHGGWLPGYWCKFRQYPASGCLIVMLSNHDFTKEDSILDRTEELLRTY